MSRCILICLLLFSLNGLFSLGQQNSVSAFDSSPIHDGWDFLGNVIRTKIKAAITTVSVLLGKWKPLTFFTPLNEECSVNLTSSSLNVRILTPNTISTMTGGLFGPDVFIFEKFSLYWQTSSPNKTNLEARVYFFNTKYITFEKALDYSDGVVMINHGIATSGPCPNPKFDGLSDIMQKKIKSPGDYSKINSGFTYTWYVSFPPGMVYQTYKSEFIDEETKKKYIAYVVHVAPDPNFSFISQSQFDGTFGKIKGVCESSILHDYAQANIEKRITPVERHQGIFVYNLPA